MRSIVIIGLLFMVWKLTEEQNRNGRVLYLSRSAILTERAVFTYKQDCDLIAKIMSEKENAFWFCE